MILLDQTLLKIIRLYKTSFNIKLFLLLRNLHLSYSRIENLVPQKGVILDLGCGYGFFPNLLAYKSPERKVIGVELSKRKLKYADIGFKNTNFVNEDIRQLEIVNCDTIVLVHVLHHLPSFQSQEKLLKECYDKLNKGAKIIVVEIDLRPLWKFWFTKFIDHVLYFGDKFYFRDQEQTSELLSRAGYREVSAFPFHEYSMLSHFVCTGLK